MHERRRFWSGDGSDHMPIHHRSKARQLWLHWAIGLVVVCWWDFTGWDRAVMHLWGDAHGFSLEHHPLLETWFPGHCFPSGHASVSWAFAPLVIAAWWPLSQPRPVAWTRLITVVFVAGAVLTGVTQTLRGAHYPSHSAWTALICWGVALAYWTLRQKMSRADRFTP